MYEKRFRILVQPITVQTNVRWGKGHFYNDPKKEAYYARIIHESKSCLPPQPFPLGTYLYLSLNFHIQDTTKQKRRGYHNQRPDRTNLLKAVEDAMQQAGFWEDDKVVCAGPIGKFWTDEDEPPHIEVHIKELTQFEYKRTTRRPLVRK